MTVDDSTSMLYDFLPDYVIDAYCRSGIGQDGRVCAATAAASTTSPPRCPPAASTSPPATSTSSTTSRTRRTSAPAAAFDVSGPGAGCELVNPPFRCSTGIDPTAGGTNPVGLKTYPAYNATTNPTASPQAGKPFEYWLLWPAPAHNSALNKLYYNPRLTYDPPIGDDGNPLPNMNAANTSNWTQVPADPWAATVVKVDLTAKVTVGQWCNSDWTQGNDASGNPFVTNAGFCRTNGTVDATSTPPADGDYSYPWPPVGITANDPFSKVDSATYARQERVDDVQGQRDGEPELLPERQRDLVQHQQHAWPRWPGTQTCNLPPRQPAAARPPAPAPACPPAPARPLRPRVHWRARRRPATGSPARCATACRARPASARSLRAARSRRPAAPARRRPATRPARPATTSRRRPATSRRRPATPIDQCTNVWQPTGCNLLLRRSRSGNCTARPAVQRRSAASPELDCTSNASVCTDDWQVQRQHRRPAPRPTRRPTARRSPAPAAATAPPCTFGGAVLDGQEVQRQTTPTARPPRCPNANRKCSITRHRPARIAAPARPTNRCGGTAGGCRVHDVAQQLRDRRRQMQHPDGTSCTTNAQLPDHPRHLQRLRRLLHVQRQLPGDRHGHLQHLGAACTAERAQCRIPVPAMPIRPTRARCVHCQCALHDQDALLQQPSATEHAARPISQCTTGWHLQRDVRQRRASPARANTQLHDQARHLRCQRGQRRSELHQADSRLHAEARRLQHHRRGLHAGRPVHCK